MIIQESTLVASCNLLAPLCQLSSNTGNAMMCFLQLQGGIIDENYVASRSLYFTCHNEFRDTFLDSPVTNKVTLSRLVNRDSSPGWIKHECMHRWTRWTFLTLNMTLFLYYDFSVIFFLEIERVWNWFREFLIILYSLNVERRCCVIPFKLQNSTCFLRRLEFCLRKQSFSWWQSTAANYWSQAKEESLYSFV